MFLVGFRGRPSLFKQLIETKKRTAPKLRDVLLEVGKVGTPANSRVCKAKVTAAKAPILRRSPYAGMLFNGQGRPLNLDGYASTLPASMGGNRTPIIDDAALYEGETPWVERYHADLMAGGDSIDWQSDLHSFGVYRSMKPLQFRPSREITSLLAPKVQCLNK